MEIKLCFNKDVCKLQKIEGSDFGVKITNFDTSDPCVLTGDLYSGQGITFLALVEFQPINASKDASYDVSHDNYRVDLGIYHTDFLEVTARWSHSLFPTVPGQPQVTMKSTNNITIKRYQPFTHLDPDHESMPLPQLGDYLWRLRNESNGHFSFAHFQNAVFLMDECGSKVPYLKLLPACTKQMYRCYLDSNPPRRRGMPIPRIRFTTEADVPRRRTMAEAVAVNDSGLKSNCIDVSTPENEEDSERQRIDEPLREDTSDLSNDNAAPGAGGDGAGDLCGDSSNDDAEDVKTESGFKDSYYDGVGVKTESGSEDSFDDCDFELESPVGTLSTRLFPILRPIQLPYSLRRNKGFTDLAGRARSEIELPFAGYGNTTELEADFVD